LQRNTLITLLAAPLAALVIACGASTGSNNAGPVTAATAGASDAPAAAATEAAAAQGGPLKLKVGEPGNLKTDAGAGTVTVTSVKVQGKSIVVAVSYTCTSGKVDYNPFYWSAIAGDGTKLDNGFDIDVKNQLSSGSIGAGQKIGGNLVYEGNAAQAKGMQIQLSVGFETAAYWTN
jgi:hypothetical protein